MRPHKLNIVDGPGHWDLMLAIFDSEGEKKKLRTVSFTVTHKDYTSSDTTQIEAQILGVELTRPYGGGNFKIKLVNLRDNNYAYEKDRFEGTYSSKSRKGKLRPLDPR